MKLTHRVPVGADRERVWAVLMDIPTVAGCIPGVRDVARISVDRYRGALDVGVGPIRLALGGEVKVVERDDAAGRAVLRANGSDVRLAGAVRALITLQVAAPDAHTTELVVDSDVQVLGRIGQLGQPLMKRKADEIMRAFATNLARLLG
jgi:carbon monoxide dehydrogenase subunit G